MNKVRIAVKKLITICTCGIIAGRATLKILDVIDGKVQPNQLSLPSID